ncbi:hypothetical protein CLV91_0798 [Maribacter vaceletii]|uniref:Lipoprotein n=1 Tax=Maribacter vaceletii TaxID=1206816 RepID=A0A495ECV3_9FLAO|nr:hypothetical protein [Maribacter vaceletii]RKR14720.1 hypothetical protein CLV91_0798 [Maribacter vaceletii]
MKRLVPLIAILFLGTILSSCSVEDDSPNFQFVPLQIISAELPESFNLEETYQIKVSFIKPNGCTSYEGFDVTKEAQTTRNVVVVGSERIDIDDCTEQAVEQTAEFNFVVLYNETYTFKFWLGETASGEDEYLEIDVPVNE